MATKKQAKKAVKKPLLLTDINAAITTLEEAGYVVAKRRAINIGDVWRFDGNDVLIVFEDQNKMNYSGGPNVFKFGGMSISDPMQTDALWIDQEVFDRDFNEDEYEYMGKVDLNYKKAKQATQKGQ